MHQHLDKLSQLARDNVPHALVTITATSGSTPREPGTKMIVLSDGRFFGTIGGGHLEQLVIADAQKCLAEQQSKSLRYPLAAKAGQCCGGSVDVFIEAIGARPELFVFGAGHVGLAVARVFQGTPFLVHLIDEREEWIGRDDIPREVVKHPLPWDAALHELRFDAERSHAVIMTHRHDTDQDLVEALVKRPLAYLGLIGSRAKWARFQQRLSRRGVGEAELARVRCPIGLPIGGKAPQEVAISLAAELLERHHAGALAGTRVVLLAGGRSERMGQPKGLVEVGGQPLLLAQVDALTALGLEVVVVTGTHHEAYAGLLAERELTIVRNPDPDRGPFSSLQEGLLGHAGSAFVLPLDVPAPRAEVWRALRRTRSAGSVPTYDDRGGHPVFLSPTLVATCQALPAASSRLDVLLAETPGIARIAVDDPQILANLNRPDDVAKAVG